MLRVVSAVCLAAVMMGATGSPAQAAGIGTITDVVNQAFRKPPGGAELPARTEDALVADETLRTEADSTLSVLFVDGSELSIEGGSEVVLSDYVFDSESDTSTGVIELNQGLFHFNSNDTADSGIALQTPIATIGIRGTEFLVTVAKDATIVDIIDGEVEVAPRHGGIAARCVGGQSALVSAASAEAICGDYGSFQTAAGVPAPTTTIAAGETREGFGIDVGDKPAPERDRPSKGPDNDPPDNDPPGGDDKGNHSGHDDGSNPGQGHGKGHDKNNGGSNNPGGSK